MSTLLPPSTAPAVLFAALLLAKVTALLAAAFVAGWLLRRASAATRHDLWSAALVATLALAAVVPLAPSIALPLVPASWVAAAVVAEPAAPADAASPSAPSNAPRAEAPAVPAIAPVVPPQPAASPAARPAAGRLPAPRLAVLFWMVGAGLVLLRCVAGHLGLTRLARRAQTPAGDDWDALLGETAAATGLRRVPRLRASDTVATPLTWGAFRPVILLPADAGLWPAERRRAALLHELAHIARGDYLAQLAGTLACAVYWFHPLAWMGLRALRREGERACDDRVLAHGASPADYATQLLEVAREARVRRAIGFAPAIAMARPSPLEGRLLAVLDETTPRRTATIRLRLAAAALAAALLVPLAGLTPAARAGVAGTMAARTARLDSLAPRIAVGTAAPVTVTAAAPVVLAAAASKGTGPSGAAAARSQSIDETLAASPGEELELDLGTGADVTIVGWDEPHVQVRGRLGGPDWRDTRLAVERTSGGVRVSSKLDVHRRSQSTSHALTIHVPRRFDVSLESAGGDFSAEGVEGRFSGRTGGGDVHLTNVRGSARLSTGGGEVRVADCNLSGTVTTGGGGITLTRVSGGLRGTSGSGPVVYAEADDDDETSETGDLGSLEVDDSGRIEGSTASSGRLHVKRAGGEIDLDEAPNGAVVSTGGGDVRIGRAGGSVEATTGGGDIVLGPIAGSVQASTGAGSIEVTLEDAGGVEQNVQVGSGSGAVTIVLPAGFDGTLDLETAYTRSFGRETRIDAPGELQRETTDWDGHQGTPRKYVRARGAVGSGRGGVVRVRTVNGDVTVRLGG